MTRYLVVVMMLLVEVTKDKQVQGEPSPDPKGEKIGKSMISKAYINNILT